MRVFVLCLTVAFLMAGCASVPKKMEVKAPTVGKIPLSKAPPEQRISRAYRIGNGSFCFKPDSFESLVHRDLEQRNYISLLRKQIQAHNVAIDKWKVDQKKKVARWWWFW